MIEKFESLFGIDLIHAWGMSETSRRWPASARLKAKHQGAAAGGAALRILQRSRASAIFGVDIEIFGRRRRKPLPLGRRGLRAT
jgi:hypothetical protein